MLCKSDLCYFRTYSAMDGHLCKHIAFLPAFCRLVSPHRKEASDALSLLQTSLILGSLHNEDTHGLPCMSD